MTDEVRNKLQEFFEARIEESREFYTVISDYFSERLTDLKLPTFQGFLDKVNGLILADCIFAASGSNEYGSYSMDESYYESHKDSSFVDSITDLGIIDLCTRYLTDIMPRTTILIKFPEVTVINEQNRSVNIKDLYVQLLIKGNKMCTFKMIRTSYDVIQWLSGYSHSHIPRVRNEEVPTWSSPCLGSGPLNSTLERLRSRYDEDVLGLFCFELSKYVTVESLAGIPYIRLESIGANNASYASPNKYNGFWDGSLFPIREFAKHFIESTPIKFSYVNGNYVLGEPLLDFWIKMSNCFIAWYNSRYKQGKASLTLSDLKRKNILKSFIISEGKACNIATSIPPNLEEINHSNMFTFKGVMQKLSIEGIGSLNQNQSILLSTKFCEYILTCILKLINYKYGKTNNKEGEGEAESGKKCYYL